MKFAQLLFSPTGGTQKVAESITRAWDAGVETLDLTNPAVPSATFQAEDLVLIAVPSYGGRVPPLAIQRLGRMRGGGAGCVLVCVYGNRAYEDTLAELQDCVESRGFHVIAAAAAVAEHSILHQYAAGRPDQRDIEELKRFSRSILEKYRQGKRELAAAIPGNRSYRKPGGAGLVPKAGSGCTGCGLCAKQCPAQAISPDDLRKTDGGKCISCMRCVVRCPSEARKVNGAMVTAAGLALKKACSVRKECELFL